MTANLDDLSVRLLTDDIDDFQDASIKKRWIYQNFDEDGYFMIQLVRKQTRGSFYDSFLTADNSSSLTIKGMYLFVWMDNRSCK